MIMSLQRSLNREKTYNKSGAQRMLDLELASVASKEYDPENIPIRGGDGGSGYRSSAKDLTVRPAKLSSSVDIRPIKNNLVNSSDTITETDHLHDMGEKIQLPCLLQEV